MKDKKLAKKVLDLTQEAYRQAWIEKFLAEQAKCVTEADIIKFKDRWNNIANQLEAGWILDPDKE